MFGVNFLPNPDDYIGVDLGPAPSGEQSPCPGFARYEDRIQQHLERWVQLLTKVFSDFKEYGHFSKVRRDGEYGPEWSVTFNYHKTKEHGAKYAEHIQENLPAKWEPDVVEILFFPPTLDEEIQEWIDENSGDNGGYPHLGDLGGTGRPQIP